MIGKVVHNALLQSSEVEALIGSRVFPVIIPQNQDTLPVITYQISNLNVIKSKSTASTFDGDVELNLYAAEYSTIQDLTQKVINALDRSIATNTIDSQTVNYFSFNSYSDGFEEDREVYMASLNFYVRKPYDNE